MSLSLEQFAELKRAAERAIAESAKAQGALAQIMSDLQSKYGCATVEQAEKLLREKQAQHAKTEKKLMEAVAAFETEYRDKL